MQQAAKKPLTPAEYLALEDAAEYKSEYSQGEIFAMAGGSLDHNRIAGNLYDGLRLKLRGGECEAFMGDVKVWIESAQLFTYPDLMVISGAPRFYEGRNDDVTNPILIVNVRRDPTQNDDCGERFKRRRTHVALQEYIMIDQYKVHVEQYSRQASFQWALKEYCSTDDILVFSSFNLKVSLRDIYAGVELTPPDKQ